MIRYEYDQNKTFADFADGMGADLKLKFLADMLRIRRIEEAIEDDYLNDQMKTPIHLVIGQEATSVGICAALSNDDTIFSTHRTHGNYLAKGGDLNAFMAELFCKTTGCAGSRGGSMHMLDKKVGMAGSSAIVAGSVPIGTGMGLAYKLKKENRVSVVFLGDAASEEGAVWESINFAALKKLPVIYVCENNYYSVCSPISSRQPEGTRIHKKAEAFGATACEVDGTNVLAVYKTAKEAVAKAKRGEGPVFIESIAYRWRGHGGIGDDSASGYRDTKEVEAWQAHCPVESYYTYLKETGQIDKNARENLEKTIKSEIETSFEFAKKSPEPEGNKALYDYLYSN